MDALDLAEYGHRRFNPLTGDWLLVSPHRAKRPWQGQRESQPPELRPAYDPGCYLCPGNVRAGGVVNPGYEHTLVFDNDFAALTREAPPDSELEDGLLRARSERGICRVICFSPRHNLTLPEMGHQAVRRVVDLWAEQSTELGAMSWINYVQIFENKGQVMGCSNPHPHGQIWAQETVPLEPAREGKTQAAHFLSNGRTLLADVLAQEWERMERLVCWNDDFVALVPFWAFWPFETLVISRRAVQRLEDLSDRERDSLADIVRKLTARYDNLFEVSFPYSAGVHQAPTDGRDHPEWHLHLHFYPPLLRSASVKKFMVGYEMLGMPQRDITPEDAAERLRGLSEVHFRQSSR